MNENPLGYPTLDRCKKLSWINFAPEPKVHWFENQHIWTDYPPYISEEYPMVMWTIWFPCPSIAELLDVIPRSVDNKPLVIVSREKYYSVRFWLKLDHTTTVFEEEYLPNALADMIILLVENKKLSLNNQPWN